MKDNDMDKPLIALDYDGTCTTNIPFWVNFVKLAEAAGYQIAIVTMRYPSEKVSMDQRLLDVCPWVITTERHGKKDFCAKFGIYPAIWIDDNPFWILHDAGDVRPTGNVKGIKALRAAQADLKTIIGDENA